MAIPDDTPEFTPGHVFRDRDPTALYWIRGSDRKVLYRHYPLRGADVESFRFFLGSFAKDRKSCYCASSKLTGGNGATFRALNFTYATDGESVWTVGGKIKEADAASFVATSTNFYDADGNLVKTKDGDGDVTSYTYDADGNKLTETTASGTTTYTYDLAGNLASVTDALGNVTSYTYNAAGEVLTTTTSTDLVKNTYTEAGDIRKSVDTGLGNMETYQYLGGQLQKETWSGASSDVQTYTYNLDGDVLKAINSNGTYTFQYNGADEPTVVVEPNGTEMKISYDSAGNRVKVNTLVGGGPAGTEVLQYDGAERLSQLNYVGQGQTVEVDYLYGTNGQELSESTYEGGTLTDTKTYGYDAAGDITSILYQNGVGGTLATYNAAYDPAGRVTSETDNGAPPILYTYDASGQLATAGASTYNFDADGNAIGDALFSNNEVKSDGTYDYTYDAAGEELTKTTIATGDTWTFGYDNAGHMTSAVETNSLSVIENSEVYKYDVFGNLTEQDMTPYVGGIPGPTTVLKYAMDDWNPAKAGSLGNSGNDTWAALDGTGLLLTENIDGSGINQHLATVSAGGIVSLLLTDRQESMRGVVDSTGTVTSTVGYDAFGNVISVGTPGEFGYAGYRYDAAPTALYMDNARVYDPASQRWLTQDPDGFDAGDSNLYRYVKNAPTIANDPSGFAEVAAQRISAPAEARGFNLVSGEHLDAGSEFRFSLTNPPAGVPANKISYQLWNNNLKRILKNGFGTSFDFDLPQVAGKFHVIFRDSRNLNGPTPIIVQSPDFVAIKAKVYNFSVRVSNSIPNAVNFAEVEVPRIFRIAQNLLLKKVAGDDFRANVSFKPGGAFVFPANGGGINGSLPDPVTSNAEARRWLTNGTNIAFVDGFPGLNGQNFGPSKAVVRNRGNNDLTAITLAHEIGHGVGLGHVNSQFGLMTGRGTNVDSIIISAAEAKAFDGGP